MTALPPTATLPFSSIIAASLPTTLSAHWLTLGLPAPYQLSGDSAKAKTKYQDFLTLWKDADPDVPILKLAKSEYAKVKQISFK